MRNHLTIFFFLGYALYFILNNYRKVDFLFILLLICFVIQYEYSGILAPEIITNPIAIRILDIPLVLMLLSFLLKFTKGELRNSNLAFELKLISIVILLFTLHGILKFGYPAIAEFRTKFYFLIIIWYFISIIRNENDILKYIKKTTDFFVPILLLGFLNMLLNGDFSISVKNRQFTSFLYESISLSIMISIAYTKYYNINKKKIYFTIITLFGIISLFASHRSVWAVNAVLMIVLMFFGVIKKSRAIPIITLVVVIIYFVFPDIISFFSERSIAYTDFSLDPTGEWRMYIWKAIYDNASFFGNGIGSRFTIYADVIGFEALAGTHNMYFTFLYYTGFLGASIFILFLIICLFRFLINYLLSRDKNSQFILLVGTLSIIASMIYMIAYELDLVSWIIISVVYAHLSLSKRKIQ